jgi:hypothetical protein
MYGVIAKLKPTRETIGELIKLISFICAKPSLRPIQALISGLCLPHFANLIKSKTVKLNQ